MFAVNVIAIRNSREARMYPLMLDATLGQVWFFARAARLGGMVNYAGAMFLALAASGATLAAVPVFVLEGFWLLYRLYRHGWWPAEPGSRHAWGLAIALAVRRRDPGLAHPLGEAACRLRFANRVDLADRDRQPAMGLPAGGFQSLVSAYSRACRMGNLSRRH